MRIFIWIALAAGLVMGCKETKTPEFSAPQPPAAVRGKLADSMMVVSAREEASQVGLEIMEMGGTAFDAMIGTHMALALTFPNAGNLGGGGFMVYRTEFGEYGSLDFREKAPGKAHRDMFLDEAGNFNSEKSTVGGLAVGVPGSVAGIFAVHEKFGTLPMEIILKPVIDLANDGFVITEKQEKTFRRHREKIEAVNGGTSLFTHSYSAGDSLKNPALAETLSRIAQNGRAEFYEGETAKKMLNYLNLHNGIMTEADLLAYEAVWREALVFEYKNARFITMAPPSSGGICVAQILKMTEPFPLAEYGHNSLRYIQLLAEAEKRSYADRSKYLGDPDFIEVPVDSLLDKNYLDFRMKSFSFDGATSSEDISPGTIPGFESMETTHYSIVDSYGNAVSVTTTLNGDFGSKLYVPDLGFFLNNEMDDFSAKPGAPNMFGLVGGTANAIEPGKRMLSSMTPTIIEKDGELWMVLGTPGGSTIITSVLQTFLNVYEFGMTMQEAVQAPRFHHQWIPDVVMFEPGTLSEEIRNQLKDLGYVSRDDILPEIGKVAAILVLPGNELEAGADPRGDDAAAGK